MTERQGEVRRRRGTMGPATSFWWFTSASALSKLGNTFLAMAVPWVVLVDGASVLVAGLSLTVQFAPYVLSPLLGRLIDRYDRRRTFLVTELLQAGIVAMIPLLLGLDSYVPTLVALLLVGLCAVVSNLTSDYALVPRLVDPADFTLAYSRYGTVTGVARCLGPAAAGLLIATVGPTTALLLDASTFLVTALVAQALPLRPVARRVRSGGGSIALFLRRRPIPRLTASLTLYNIGAGALPVMILLASQRYWGWSADHAGVMLAAIAGGSALGAWLAGRWWLGQPLGRRITRWFGCCVLAGCLLLAGVPGVVAVALVLLGMAEGGMTVTTNELRVRVIPEDEVGRVNSVVRGLAMGLVPASALLTSASAGWGLHALWVPVLVGSLLALLVWVPAARTSSREDLVAA